MSRRNRHFVPSTHKDEYYWMKRQKNNEAARKSREKRRMNDLVLEQKVLELLQENLQLKRDLLAVKVKYKEIDPEQMQGIIQYMAEQQKMVGFAKPDSRLSRLQLIMDEPGRSMKITPKEEPLRDGVFGIHESSMPSAPPGQPRSMEAQSFPITMLGNDWRKYFCHGDTLFPTPQKSIAPGKVVAGAAQDTVSSMVELATYPQQDPAHLAATTSGTCEIITSKKCRHEPEICVKNGTGINIKPEQALGSQADTNVSGQAFVKLASGGAGTMGNTWSCMDGATTVPNIGKPPVVPGRIGHGQRPAGNAACCNSSPSEFLRASHTQEQSRQEHSSALQAPCHQQHGPDVCSKDVEIGPAKATDLATQSLAHELHKSPSESVNSDSSSGFESSESLSPAPNQGSDEAGAGDKVRRLPCKLRFKLASAPSS